MRTALALSLVLAALVPTPLRADPPSASPGPGMPGGWSEIRPDDPELQAAARFVVPRLPRPRARLAQIEGGEHQVVAGMNYRVALRLTDGTRWRALVWQKLDGKYELTRFAQVR